jgi:hypothetical protein
MVWENENTLWVFTGFPHLQGTKLHSTTLETIITKLVIDRNSGTITADFY